jgi:hypothetical protein
MQWWKCFLAEFKLRRIWVLSMAVLCFPVTDELLLAQEDPRVTQANYTLAARFTPARMSKLVKSTSVNPGWLEHSERFWYSYETTEGKSFFIVDPANKTKAPAKSICPFSPPGSKRESLSNSAMAASAGMSAN